MSMSYQADGFKEMFDIDKRISARELQQMLNAAEMNIYDFDEIVIFANIINSKIEPKKMHKNNSLVHQVFAYIKERGIVNRREIEDKFSLTPYRSRKILLELMYSRSKIEFAGSKRKGLYRIRSK